MGTRVSMAYRCIFVEWFWDVVYPERSFETACTLFAFATVNGDAPMLVDTERTKKSLRVLLTTTVCGV